jgi:hypothetical protein
MKILFALLVGLVLFVVYDYKTYDKKQKIEQLKNISKQINFHTVKFDFKSKNYKEFVYAK